MSIHKGPGFKLVPKTSTSSDDAPFTPGSHRVITIPYCEDPNKAAFVDELLLRYYSKQQAKQKDSN